LLNFVANKIQMKILERIKNYFRLFSIKRNEAIYTCIQNDIPLTDENIKEVMGILKHKENKQLLKNFKKEN
jgi:hypothetical protein